MRLGILITSIGNFGKKGFYNAQEIGLAKEMDKLFEEVIVYKAVPQYEQFIKNNIEGCKNAILYQIPVKNYGINASWDCSVMDTELDAIVYFSDTQLVVPKVNKWCKKNHIKLYPYIGVCESHSTSKIKKLIIDLLFQRNLQVYKKCICFVKTPNVATRLSKRGVKNIVLSPVGLDISLMKKDLQEKEIIRQEFGYTKENTILLYIGRMTEEKQPIRMVEVFKAVYEKNKKARLIMVGKGELLDDVKKAAQDCAVTFIEQIPNDQIHKLYLLTDVFVNLNQQEIFGMAILEAMYYGCTVVAFNAPGPSFIIENGKSGWLVNTNNEAVDAILTKGLSKNDIKERVISNFLWNSTAGIMHRKIKADIKKIS